MLAPMRRRILIISERERRISRRVDLAALAFDLSFGRQVALSVRFRFSGKFAGTEPATVAMTSSLAGSAAETAYHSFLLAPQVTMAVTSAEVSSDDTCPPSAIGKRQFSLSAPVLRIELNPGSGVNKKCPLRYRNAASRSPTMPGTLIREQMSRSFTRLESPMLWLDARQRHRLVRY